MILMPELSPHELSKRNINPGLPDKTVSTRLALYSRVLLISISIAFLVVLSTGSGPNTISGRIGGDFPAFYSAGQIIVAGEQRKLYSAETQRKYQKALLSDGIGLLPFAYPPFVAVA